MPKQGGDIIPGRGQPAVVFIDSTKGVRRAEVGIAFEDFGTVDMVRIKAMFFAQR